MPILSVNGASLEYTDHGAGEPLVLVHGSASDHRTWHNQLGEFAKRYRTIAYSRRYHWPNQAIPEGVDYAMAEHVDDLEQLLHSLRAAPAHLVGHSYGGFIALLLAMRAPQLVRTLILAEAPAITLFVSDPPRPAELARLLVTRPRTAFAIIRFGAKGVGPAAEALKRNDRKEALRLIGTATLGPRAFRNLPEARLEQARANLIKAELLGSGFPPVAADRVRALRTPTLLVDGAESPSLFHHVTDRLEELLPDAARIEIAGASHIMHEDNAAAYNASVLTFLGAHRPA